MPGYRLEVVHGTNLFHINANFEVKADGADEKTLGLMGVADIEMELRMCWKKRLPFHSITECQVFGRSVDVS